MISTISMSAKCSDQCYMAFYDEKGCEVGERTDYVPDFMPDEHDGDYILLEINVETGQIVNWKKPTQAQLKSAIK